MYSLQNQLKNQRSIFNNYFHIIITLLCLIPYLGSAQSQSNSSTLNERIALFNYENTSFNIKIVGKEKRGDITIKDITFIGSPGKPPIKAYLVEPKGKGKFAGILWGHWLGHHSSDRTQYLEEAIQLASKGVVSFLFDAMWAKPKWYQTRDLEKDYESSIQQVIEINRAMDLLMSQKNVDKSRVAYVGHDYSGMYGSIAAGVNPRAKTYVFIAVTSSLTNWAFLVKQPKSKIEYIRKNVVFELTDYVSQIKGSVFCQFSSRDPFIAKTDGNVFYNAINSKVKERKRYDADHDMKGDDITKDRNEWLIKELELEK